MIDIHIRCTNKEDFNVERNFFSIREGFSFYSNSNLVSYFEFIERISFSNKNFKDFAVQILMIKMLAVGTYVFDFDTCEIVVEVEQN